MKPVFLQKAVYDDIFTKDRNFYRKTTNRHQYPILRDDTKTDVLIIGGGLSGLATAHYLSEMTDMDITLIERHFLGWGASGRNGGQVLPGYMMPPGRMVRKFGMEQTKAMWDISLKGVDQIAAITKKYGIDCHLTPGAISPIQPEYYNPDAHKKKRDLLNELGVETEIYDADQTQAALNCAPDAYRGALVKKSHAYHFHPLRYTQGLAHTLNNRIRIFEGTGAVGIDKLDEGDFHVYTAHGMIQTKKIILCGDSYLGLLAPSLRRKYVLIRNGMIATNVLNDDQQIMPENQCASEYGGELFFYRKTYDNRLIIGGGDAVRPNSNFLASEERIIESLKSSISKIFPSLKTAEAEYVWGGYIGVTTSYMPYVGTLDPNVFYMGGYSGHGVNLTHAIGALVAAAVKNNSTQTGTPLDLVRHMSLPGKGNFDVTLARIGMLLESIYEQFD